MKAPFRSSAAQPRDWRILAALAAALLVLAGWTLSIGAPETAAKEGKWSKVTLLYQSDVKGKIEPCG